MAEFYDNSEFIAQLEGDKKQISSTTLQWLVLGIIIVGAIAIAAFFKSKKTDDFVKNPISQEQKPEQNKKEGQEQEKK